MASDALAALEQPPHFRRWTDQSADSRRQTGTVTVRPSIRLYRFDVPRTASAHATPKTPRRLRAR
eukprot:3138712-Pyramimonas_sp.AAC.1